MPTKLVLTKKRSSQTKSSSRSKRSWRETQNSIKNKKKTRLALIVLGAILLLLILGQLFRLVQILISPWGSDIKKDYGWDSKFSINLVLKDSSVSFFSYNPQEKKIRIINLPDNLEVDVPFGMGRWQLSSVFDLGESEKKGGGTFLLKKTLSNFLGVPLDGVLRFEFGGNQFEKFRKEINIYALLKNIKSDLSLIDILKLKFALSSVRFDKVEVIKLVDLYILDEASLADGTKVYIGDSVKLDSVVSGLSDPLISKEHKSVAVFNATDTPLLAQSAARLITNLGANVIVLANSAKFSERTYIQADKSDTKNRLLQIFDPKGCTYDKECEKISTDDLGVSSVRADIIVVLGRDYIK